MGQVKKREEVGVGEVVTTGVALDNTTGDLYVDAGDEVERYSFNGSGAVVEPGGATCPVEPSAGCKPTESFGSGTVSGGAGIGVDASNATVYVTEATTGRVDVFPLQPLSRPAVRNQSVAEVTSDSATFEGDVDANGESTEVRVEYGRCATEATCATSPYEKSSTAEPVGAEFAYAAIAPLHVQDLSPGTIYHYRLAAENNLGTEHGAEEVFTTRGTGGFGLPDGRAWELVSPADKHGALIEPIGEAWVIQAAAEGGAITYLTDAPTESEPAGYDNFQQVLSSRGPGGWASQNLALPHSASTELSIGQGNEYRFFSEDLSRAVVQPFGPFTACEDSEGAPQPCLSPEASEQTASLRELNTGVYTPLVTGCPGEGKPCEAAVREHADVPEGTIFGQENRAGESCPRALICGPEFLGGNPDLSDVILTADAPLKPGAGSKAMYEWSAGKPAGEHLKLVAPSGAVLGGKENPIPSGSARHAISVNGARVVWSLGGHLYLSETDGAEPVERVQLDTGLGGAAEFQTASSEVSVVFFTDSGDLYAYNVEEGHRELLAEGVEGALPGASEDGAYVYYAAASSLYVDHHEASGWKSALIAALSGADDNDWGRGEDSLTLLTARVSPNGEWLAFMSQRSLTGYDNDNAVSGEPDEGVYLYSASTGRLACASCDPTGARPHGVRYDEEGGVIENMPLAGGFKVWESSAWIAANVPGWTPYTIGGGEILSGPALYQSRYLSNEGRLFFNARDALVPKDVNGAEDVYEYEPEGVGAEAARCGPSAASGSVVFKPERSLEVEGKPVTEGAGCVGLISSGESAQESAFLDANESGSEVFFLSTAKLTSLDTEGGLSVFDAHECTAASPCLTAPGEALSACSEEASCKAAAVPQPEIYGLPSSATFSGAGNSAPESSSILKPKVLTRAQKLAAALKKCRKDRSKKKRVACEKQAIKSYGPKKAKKATGAQRVK